MGSGKRSLILFISNLLASLYTWYLFDFFVMGTKNAEGGEAVGLLLATIIVAPHMLAFLLGAIFGWIGFLFKQSWAALVAAIIYAVGTIFLPTTFVLFTIPMTILGFIGFARQNKC